MKTNLNSSLTGTPPMTSRPGRSTVRRASNLTTATHESSAQPERRPTFRANLRKPGLLHPPPSATTLPQPAPFHLRCQSPVRALRVRLAPGEHKHQITSHAAGIIPGNVLLPVDSNSPQNRSTTGASRWEEFIFQVILALALFGVIQGLAGLKPLAGGLNSFVSLVRHWVG